MKVTVDDESMIVEIDSTIKLVDLISGLKNLLGDDWKKYSIQQRWSNYYYPNHLPIIYHDVNPVPEWNLPSITCTTN